MAACVMEEMTVLFPSFDPADEVWGPFMRDEVHPLMAEQLGYEEYDPNDNTDGFGCDGCHSNN